MQELTFTDDDEGKKVLRGDDSVGRIVDVEHGTAYVDPDPGLTESIKSKLGWSDGASDADTYPLQEEAVERVDDDAVHIKERL